MLALWNCVVRFQLVATGPRPVMIYIIVALALAGGCAQQPERISALGASRPAASPWALATSTMR
jgi:hypothetical protein